MPLFVGAVTTRVSAVPVRTVVRVGCSARGIAAASGSVRSRSPGVGLTMMRPTPSTTWSWAPPPTSAVPSRRDRWSSANTVLSTPTGRVMRGARIATSYSSDTTAVDRGPHHGGRCGQRLGLVAPLPQVLVHERGDPQRHVLAPVLRLLLHRALGRVAGQSGETDHEDQGDADPREEKALAELRGAAGHVMGLER